jgi:polyhydroxyalkanoate synthase subunit PhaC
MPRADPAERFWMPFRIVENAAHIDKVYGQRTRSEVIFCENKMRVLHYEPRRTSPAGPARFIPLVMTAPLVMPHYVMDLRPGKSLVEYLCARGLDVFMIDWGVPDRGDRFDTLDEYVTRYLRHAVQAVCQVTQQPQVVLHGYCQGALLAVLFTCLYPARVRGLVNQTGPVNFHDEGIYSLWTRRLNVDLLVDTLGNVPAELLRMSFQLTNPTGALAQTLRYYEHIEDEQFVADYIAMNTWLNDIVPLPGEFFRKFVHDLYQRNLLVQGRLEIAGRCIDLSRITCSLLTIAGEKDRVVPWKSAAILNEMVSSRDRELLLLPSGHLGMTVGHDAAQALWPALADWVISRSFIDAREQKGESGA